jgi:hypothetical protein
MHLGNTRRNILDLKQFHLHVISYHSLFSYVMKAGNNGTV